jgi:hypothetical protein
MTDLSRRFFPHATATRVPDLARPRRPMAIQSPTVRRVVVRRIALIAIAVAAVASVAAYMGSASGQSNGDAAPIYGIKIPDGYRDWRLISVKQLTGSN